MKRWGMVVCVAALLLCVRALPGVNLAFHNHPWDGKIGWLAARAFVAGFNPYSAEGFDRIGHPALGMGHQPSTGFWFLPFASLEVQPMAEALNTLVLVLLFLHCVLVAAELRWPEPVPLAALAFSLVLSTSFMRYHFAVGQLSEVIAFLYVLAWLALRRKADVLGGVMLGLACTMKLFPGVMVLALLFARRWRAVFAAAAAFLPIAAVMSFRFGLVSWPQFFAMQPPITNAWLGDLANMSIHGIVLRAFRPTLYAHPPIPVATWIAVAASLGLLGAALYLSRKPSERAFDVRFALFGVLSIFINPVCWEHYDVFLLAPLAVAGAALWQQRLRAIRWTGLAITAAIVVLFFIDREAKWQARKAFYGQKGPLWLVHFYEVTTWLPLVLTLGLLFFLVARMRKS